MSKLMISQSYINGQWRDANDGATFEVKNPYNDELLGKMADMTSAETQDAIDAAYEAFKSWRQKSAKERAVYLMKWFELMKQNVDELAEILTKENGKPITESKGEVLYAASFLEWYAAEGRRVFGDVVNIPGSSNRRGQVLKQPIGVAGVIIPWNFPYAMITRKVAAALCVGCTVVIKSPEDTPYCGAAAIQLAHEAGIPAGVVNILSCRRENASSVGKLMCESKKISTVSFTGSTAVGATLMAQCAPTVKKVSLELGGLAPCIVFESANLDEVATGTVFCKYRNAGQACISAQNFLIHESIYDACVEKLVEVSKSLKLGNGLTAGVTIGPLINQRGIDKVARLVEDAVSKGAQVLCGGRRATEIGSLFYEPTVLTNVTQDMDIVHQEVFGPVITCIKFKTEEEALKIANQSDRGLAGYFFSKDLSQCYRVQEQLEMGLVGCNTGAISCTELPFSGFKQSGIGSESGVYGVDEFLLIKSVVTNI